ncbi:hypothetical protein O0L34_g13951 [Tuta absoluta]|nr:hypothetical protein O0L34_g13951 [Tuta absoluta]
MSEKENPQADSSKSEDPEGNSGKCTHCQNKSCMGKNLKFQQGLGIWGNLCKKDLGSPPSSPPPVPAIQPETPSALQRPILKPEEKPAPLSHPPPPTSQQSLSQPHSQAKQPAVPHNPHIKPEPKK